MNRIVSSLRASRLGGPVARHKTAEVRRMQRFAALTRVKDLKSLLPMRGTSGRALGASALHPIR
jgi:hypothetical protein